MCHEAGIKPVLIGATSQLRKAQEERAAKQAALPAAKAAAAAQEKAAAALGRRHKPTVLSKELVMAELKRLCEPDEDGDEATTIAALTASIKAFFPHLMAPQDAVGKVEGFIKQLAADQVLVIVAGGGLCLM